MGGEFTAQAYPFAVDGPLCELLDDEQFLFDVYVAAGGRQSIKAFCKKHSWPGKPSVAVSVGESELKSLLRSLFGSPRGRLRLAKVLEAAKRKGKEGPPPLYQAIWSWLMEHHGELADRIKDRCHERRKGLLFLAPDALGELADEFARGGSDGDQIVNLARAVLAFAMLQPEESLALAGAFLGHFPAWAPRLGLVPAT